MSAPAPVLMEYQGDGSFRAVRPVAVQCDKQYTVHERYRMVVEEERSEASHGHQFANIDDSWHNLPDHLALQFTSADNLRKHALIMTGWRHERRCAFSSAAEARKAAAFIMQIATEYTLASVAGNVVVVWTARSQKMRGPDRMNKADFQKSKQDIFDWIDDLLGVVREKPVPATRPTKQVNAPRIAPDQSDSPAPRALEHARGR